MAIDRPNDVIRALMAALDGGVVVCDAAGAVLLHDDEAAQIWRSVASSGDGKAPLSGSLFEVMDEQLLTDAFEAAERNRAADEAPAFVEFVTAIQPDRLLRIRVRCVPGEGKTRYLLQCCPVRRWNEVEVQRHQLLQSLSEGMRDPLASVRAAIETMIQYPAMDDEVAQQFRQIIRDQSVALSEHLDDALDAYAQFYRSTWPLDETTGRDLLALLHGHLTGALNASVDVQAEASDADESALRLRIDPYMMRQAIAFLAERIVNATQCSELTLRLRPIRQFAALDLQWDGTTVTPERLSQWQSETIPLEDTVITMSLREIIEHHDGELWAHEEGGRPGVRIVLPTA